MKAATEGICPDCYRKMISIHAAREGGDTGSSFFPNIRFISIHAAREGGDLTRLKAREEAVAFQSTPPVKAATGYHCRNRHAIRISIHAAREGGDVLHRPLRQRVCISIHAAREGGDALCKAVYINIAISIHAAREGGDIRAVYYPLRKKYFNPRRP